MSKLWLIGLAASAAWTPAAIAQGAPPPPPPPPPPMAHGAHAPGAAMTHHPGMHSPMAAPGQMHGRMKGMHRFGRGHILPPQFRGRQFMVNDWRMFGFPAPMPGGHWVRYQDDALLIDGDGRVMDGRYGWDWEGRGGGMAHDDRDDHHGYVEDEYGAGDDYGRDDHHAEDGHHGGRERIVRVIRRGDGARGDCRRNCARVRQLPPPPPHPGYGYGYGQGYGYGYGGYGYGAGYGYGGGCGCGPVVITETTTTTAPVVEMRTYYETVREPRAAPRRAVSKPVVRYSKPVVRRSVKAAPAPRPGERG